ncbi:MAG: Ig-like domain-containing protein, partial [Verrucomicrobia bacterium]|nr:Ig-like domain-containing protein [Verrucomicrobiota bacterium]
MRVQFQDWLRRVFVPKIFLFNLAVTSGVAFLPDRANGATPELTLQPLANHRLQLIWPATSTGFVLEQADALGAVVSWSKVAQTPVLAGGQLAVTLDTSTGNKFFRLHAPLVTIAQSSPLNGEMGVAVTRETIVHLSAPLSTNAVVGTNNFYAGFAGRRILSRVELSSDRTKASLFYLEPMPGSTRVNVVFDGAGLTDEMGRLIDADGDGVAGGATVIAFDTLNLTALAGTAVTGTVYASDLVPGSDTGTNAVNQPLAGVTITVDGREQDLRAVTDANGNFTLSPAPPGRFFVHIDGRTAVNPAAGIHYPDQSYYPYVGKAWEALAGRTDNLAGGTGKIYLPLIVQGTLQPVSMTSDTTISFPPSVVASNPALAGVSITVPANSLFSDDGTRGGKVGIAPVPPDRLPGPLPPGLELPLVITVQTDGALNFDKPAPICFPNLHGLKPGEQTTLVSFNHKKGIWEAVGSMTASADAKYVCTDPGVGILQPGWHGDCGCKPDGPQPPCGACRCPAPPTGPSPTARVSFPDQRSTSYTEDMQSRFNISVMGPGKKKRPPKPPKPPKDWGPAPCPNPLPPPPPTCSDGDNQACIDACGDAAQACEDKAHSDFATNFVSCVKGTKINQKCVNIASFKYGQAVIKCQKDFATCAAGCIPRCNPLPRVAAQTSAMSLAPLSIPNRRRTSVALTSVQSASSSDALVAEINQLLEQIVTVVTPFVDAATWPANVEATVEQLSAQLDAISNGQYPELLAQHARRVEDARFFNLFDTYYSYDNSPPYPVAYVAEIKRANGQQLLLRGETQAFGQYSLFIPRDGQLLSVRFYDRLTKSYAIIEPDPDADPGSPLPYFTLFYLSGDEIDSDNDGLPDVVESVFGTNPNNPDSDGDGIPDGAEVDQGTNPLDGAPVQTGIIATAKTPGSAVDICAANDLVITAEGAAGISIFNAYTGDNPTIIAHVPTPGNAQRVACAGNFVAVAQPDAGLSIVDVSTPASARIIQQVRFSGAQAVAVGAGKAYAGLDSGLIVVVDLATGVLVNRVSVTNAVWDLGLTGNYLYALTDNQLFALSLEGGKLLLTGSTVTPFEFFPNRRLFVSGGIGYSVHRTGFNSLDLTDPAKPVLIKFGKTSQFGWKQIIANGSGLGLAAVGPNSTDDGRHDISLYDLSSPTNTDVFITTFPMPGIARALTLYNGLAYVAADAAGLQVVNYLAYDSKGVPPQISLVPGFDPNGVEAGKREYVNANATDDVQVRNVEFYLDGAKVFSDGNFPFEYRFVTPAFSATKTNFTLRARAFDTGGNATWSDEIAVKLVPDTTPPSVISTTPIGGGARSLTSVQAYFSEPLNPNTVTAASFHLFAAGADGEIGTADDVLVSAGVVSYDKSANAAVFTFGTPLPVSRYRAVITTGVTDLAGNRLAADYVWDFQVADAKFWVNLGDSAWDDPSNWDNGVVPTPSDNVIINFPVTVFLKTGMTLSQTVGGITGARLYLYAGAGIAATFDALTLNVNLLVDGNAKVRVINGLTLNGVATMNGGLNRTQLNFDGTQTFDGTGEVIFTDPNNSTTMVQPVNGTLMIGPKLTIRGSGAVGRPEWPLINHGTILGENALTMRVLGS